MAKRYSYGVSAAHPLAVEAGMAVLAAGGNAVDAAIAVSYMLGVVEPYASGIGGGGVMLVVPTGEEKPVICDYRETAPMSGIVSEQRVGVPGLVRGMESVHERYGQLAMEVILEPAITAAEEGFPAGPALHRQLTNTEHLPREQFPHLYPEGEPLRTGERLKQPLLAATLRSIRDGGSSWFYEGEAARQISSLVEGMEESDFNHYRVEYREPLSAMLGDYRFLTCPPPFGGVTLLQALLISDMRGHYREQPFTSAHLHQWGEIIGQCYTLRSTTMGDPAYCEPPVEWLLSGQLIEEMAANVREEVGTRNPGPGDVANTTHFCVADRNGMVVSVTNTVGGFFTTGLNWGGFFLNNQLRNFSEDEGSLNLPEPGKRPQSYVCPTVLCSDKQTVAIGSAGGKRIPLVLAAILTAITRTGTGIEEAVAAPRFFIDQNTIYTEESLSRDVEQQLTARGYEVKHHPDAMFYGGVHGLLLSHESGRLCGAADPRRGGAWRTE